VILRRDRVLRTYEPSRTRVRCGVVRTSRCFMRTATTTLTSTNCAISTKTTKKTGAMIWFTQQFRTQSADSSQSSRSVSCRQQTHKQLGPRHTTQVTAIRISRRKLESQLCKPDTQETAWYSGTRMHDRDSDTRNLDGQLGSYAICLIHYPTFSVWTPDNSSYHHIMRFFGVSRNNNHLLYLQSLQGEGLSLRHSGEACCDAPKRALTARRAGTARYIED